VPVGEGTLGGGLHLLDTAKADAVEAHEPVEDRIRAPRAGQGERAPAGPVGFADAVGLGGIDGRGGAEFGDARIAQLWGVDGHSNEESGVANIRIVIGLFKKV
jgi:hypothetical protein